MYSTAIKTVLTKEKKNQPTLIQKRSYQLIKDGANVIGLAKTGTGKTLAYALPLLEKTDTGAANSLVIFAPTTELAVQIRRALMPYCQSLDLKILALVGAGNRKRQEENLKKRHPEVIVATPGRFFDFFSSGRIKLGQIKALVIDEADDILEFAKEELLTSLIQNLPATSQVLLFGATTSDITNNADSWFDRQFLVVDVRPEQKLATRHYFLQVDNRHKIDFVQRLVKLDRFKGILFFNSNDSLERFAGIFGHTKTKFTVLAAAMGKQQQEQALKELATGQSQLLLATDAAARGLDIPKLTYVVNFDLPTTLAVYLHRAGRTGRMQQAGYVVSLGDDHDFRDLKKIVAGHLQLQRAYFAGFQLSTQLPPKEKDNDRAKNKTAAVKVKQEAKKKHRKKRRKRLKNKGYHPHYLKEKKWSI